MIDMLFYHILPYKFTFFVRTFHMSGSWVTSPVCEVRSDMDVEAQERQAANAEVRHVQRAASPRKCGRRVMGNHGKIVDGIRIFDIYIYIMWD